VKKLEQNALKTVKEDFFSCQTSLLPELFIHVNVLKQ